MKIDTPFIYAGMRITVFLLLIAMPSGFAFAHGEAGMTFSDVVDGYYVDVDYSEAFIEAGRSGGRFTFDIYEDEEKTKPVEYTDLWVRIVQDNGNKAGKTIFAGPVYRTQFGGTGFMFTFPESGTHTMFVRYNNSFEGSSSGDTLTEAEFQLDVLRSEEENKFSFGFEFWMGLLIGVLACAVLGLPLLLQNRRGAKTP